jgi:hypothetical protein
MAKNPELTHYLIFIRAELPQGENTLRSLISATKRYRTMMVEERTLFTIIRGKETPREWEAKMWVAREDYQPLCNKLMKKNINPKPRVNRFAPL